MHFGQLLKCSSSNIPFYETLRLHIQPYLKLFLPLEKVWFMFFSLTLFTITAVMTVLQMRAKGKERSNKVIIKYHMKIVVLVLLPVFLLPAIKLHISPILLPALIFNRTKSVDLTERSKTQTSWETLGNISTTVKHSQLSQHAAFIRRYSRVWALLSGPSRFGSVHYQH